MKHLLFACMLALLTSCSKSNDKFITDQVNATSAVEDATLTLTPAGMGKYNLQLTQDVKPGKWLYNVELTLWNGQRYGIIAVFQPGETSQAWTVSTTSPIKAAVITKGGLLLD